MLDFLSGLAKRILNRTRHMRVLTGTTLFDTLRDWGLHEALGRLPAMGVAIEAAVIDALRRGGHEADVLAADICLHVRRPVVVRVLAAHPVEFVRVELVADDIARLSVMSAATQPRRPLSVDAAVRVTGTDQDNDWTRDKIAKREPVEGPLFAVGRAVPGELTILDGIHRAAVWATQAEGGLRYPITANVAITTHSVWFEGL